MNATIAARMMPEARRGVDASVDAGAVGFPLESLESTPVSQSG
jgi:hypothetical protein